MKRDDHLIFEALQKRLSAEYDHKNQVAKVNVTPEEIGKFAGMIKSNVFKKKKQSTENAESKFLNPQGVETYALNQLDKMVKALEGMSTAIHLSKSSAVDQLLSRLRDTAEMLMSERGSGTSENAEEEGELMTHMKQQGMIAKNAQVTLPKHETEEAENASAFHYDPMPGLAKAAHQIREILQGAANDEARTEHIIKMAQIILGDPKEHAAAEYRKMLDGLIVTLNRFIVVPMNEYEEGGVSSTKATDARSVANNAITAAWDHLAGI